MIEQQIRPWNVLEMQTLEVLKKIQREEFVPSEYRHIAFTDTQIPLGDDEVMLEPKVGARLVESLHISADDNLLEIGSGSGYLTALLASLSAHVTSIEINPRLFAQAQKNLANASITNINMENGDATVTQASWGTAGQFNAILVSGSLPKIDDDHEWLNLLADGGKLIGIVGYPPVMQVIRLTKTHAGVLRDSLFDTTAPRLHNVEEKPEFQF